MKKRTAFIGAILSLISIGQPLITKSGVVLSTTGFILFVPEKAMAESSGDFYFNRGNDKADTGDHYGAIIDFTKAIEINPQDADAFFNRGNSKSAIKDYYGSIYDYTNSIEIDSSQSDYFINRGLSRQNIGDKEGACSDWEKASSLGSKKARTWVDEDC